MNRVSQDEGWIEYSLLSRCRISALHLIKQDQERLSGIN